MKIKLELKHRIMLGLALSFCFVLLSMQNVTLFKTRIIIKPNQGGLITAIIQKAIDSCASTGGGKCVVLKTVDSFLRYPQGDKIPVFCYLL